MAAVGLRSDAHAVEQGAAAIRAWVTAGKREVDRAELEAEIAGRSLHGGEARATLLVQALDRMPWADAATVSLDWVDHFEGSNPRERVQLREPAGWTGLLTRELEEAERTIRARGFHKVEVRGFMRLPVWFAVGATFADTRGFRLTCEQRGERWSTEEHPSRFEATVVVDEIGAGEDLALGLSVARDLGADVRRYVAAAELPVRRFVHLAAVPAPSNHALADAAAARALAGQVRDLVAAEVGATGARRVHLFLATPGGAALLLGYVWNRMPATQVYEDLGPGRGYTPTFLIPG